MHMYDVTVAAVRAVDERLIVGGPSSAASGWVEELLAHVEDSGAPLDFVSTHTYGSPPLDFRPSLERYGRAGTPIWWTEWGGTPTHFNEVSDAVFSGVFLLRGWPRRWTGSRRCPTGWSRTTSRSSAVRRRCCTAGSAFALSGSCASPAGGRWPCWNGWVRRGSRSPCPATERAHSSRHWPPGRTPAR